MKSKMIKARQCGMTVFTHVSFLKGLEKKTDSIQDKSMIRNKIKEFLDYIGMEYREE